MYLKCARNQQQQPAKIGNYGPVYADGIAVGVEHFPGAQGAATSAKMDQMVTNTPTALPSAYRTSQTHQLAPRGTLGRLPFLWVPQRLRRRLRIRRRLFVYADGLLRRWRYADGRRRPRPTPTANVPTPTASGRRRIVGFP